MDNPRIKTYSEKGKLPFELTHLLNQLLVQCPTWRFEQRSADSVTAYVDAVPLGAIKYANKIYTIDSIETTTSTKTKDIKRAKAKIKASMRPATPNEIISRASSYVSSSILHAVNNYKESEISARIALSAPLLAQVPDIYATEEYTKWKKCMTEKQYVDALRRNHKVIIRVGDLYITEPETDAQRAAMVMLDLSERKECIHGVGLMVTIADSVCFPAIKAYVVDS